MSSTTTLRSLSVWSICCSQRMIWARCAQLLGSADTPEDPSSNRATTSPASQRLVMAHLRLSNLQAVGHRHDTASAWRCATEDLLSSQDRDAPPSPSQS